SSFETVALRFKQAAQPVRAKAPGVPQSYDGLCMALLAIDPAKRPTAAKVIEAFEKIGAPASTAGLEQLFATASAGASTVADMPKITETPSPAPDPGGRTRAEKPQSGARPAI